MDRRTDATSRRRAAADSTPAGAGEVWVFVESRDGRPAEVSLELLGKARALGQRLGVTVGAVLPGAGRALRALAPALVAGGADTVYVIDHAELATYRAQPFARVLAELVRHHRPQVVLYGATTTGRDLAPRVASALRTGLTADCTDLQIGEHTVRGRVFKDLLLQIRPAFGGNIIATIVCPEHRPQMATVREGVMRLPEPDDGRRGRFVDVAVGLARSSGSAGERSGDGAADGSAGGPILLQAEDLAVQVLERVQQEKRVDLKAARIVVAGGAGVGSKENFALVHDLARALGGVVAASRAAVDAGWIDHDHQVGQTGTTVRPKLYVALGISGSVQHRAGMDQSARILAINTDPSAPIFSVAHYGIVGDLNDVVPTFIKAYRAKGET